MTCACYLVIISPSLRIGKRNMEKIHNSWFVLGSGEKKLVDDVTIITITVTEVAISRAKVLGRGILGLKVDLKSITTAQHLS